MQLKFFAIALTTALFSAQATAKSSFFSPEESSINISLGALSGKTKERVYFPDKDSRKISQLDWKYNNAAIIKGEFDRDLAPWLSIRAAGWHTLGAHGSNMVDRDWLAPYPHTKLWTDESRHPNTSLNYANEFDLGIKGWVLNEPARRFGLMAGYKESRYSFKAVGGTYTYSGNGGFRNITGSLPDGGRMVGYKQRFKMPYIGLTGNYRYADIEFSGEFKYSGWVQTSDNDEHYARRITYRSKVDKQNYYSVAVNAGYYVTSNAKIYVEGAWDRITNKKGSTSIYDRVGNKIGKIDNIAGVESYNFITTAGLKYYF